MFWSPDNGNNENAVMIGEHISGLSLERGKHVLNLYVHQSTVNMRVPSGSLRYVGPLSYDHHKYGTLGQ